MRKYRGPRPRTQIAVGLSDHHRELINKISQLEDRSVSSIAAEAIVPYLDAWEAEYNKPKTNTSLFSRIAKRA
jgi:hypothetical protein